MKFKIATSLLVVVLCATVANPQRRRNNNRNRPNRNRVTVAPTVGGKWRPRQPTRTGTPNRRPSTVNRRPQVPRPTGELITPPSRRMEGEAALQEPSWVHCLHNMEITSNWAMINNQGYPSAIVGQMQCSWIFYGARNTRIRISFIDIDLQPGEAGRCGTQFVDVIDLQYDKSQGRFCGSDVPGDYVTVSNRLRLDIQGDTTIIPHKGFRAFVRSVPLTTTPGMRQQSLKYHGSITTTTRRPTTRRPVLRRTSPAPIIPRQPINRRTPVYLRPTNNVNIYGPNNQPQQIEIPVQQSSPNIGIYVAVGILCFLIVLMGLGFVFRKKLREKYNTFMGHQPPSDENANKTESTYVSGDKLSLPGYSPSASPRYPRRKSGCGCSRSVTFEDEIEEESRSTNAYSYDPYAKSSSVYDSQTDGLDAGSCKFDQYDYFRSRCPEDDTISMQSFHSVRSTNRHPDHVSFKMRKLEEMNNYVLSQEENPYGVVESYHPEPIYSTHIDQMPPAYYSPAIAQQHARPNYELLQQHSQEAAMMMQQLQQIRPAHSVNDLSLGHATKPQEIQRASSMAKLPVESDFLKRHIERRQSFRL